MSNSGLSCVKQAHQVQDTVTMHEPSGLSRSDFETFVSKYSPRLLAVARRILRSEEDAADAVQDALLAAYAARSTYRGKSTVFTWLHRIVVNTCLMKCRVQRRFRVVSLHGLPSAAMDEHGLESSLGWAVHQRDHVEGEETAAVVRSCIDRLPNDFREAVWLRDIQELEMDRAAAMLNLSYVAFKTRLHRARQALRQQLTPLI